MPKFEISQDGTKATVYFYDVIGENFWEPEESLSAKQFASDLQSIGPVQEINVRINSPGGSIFDARAMANLLKAHPARKVVDIDGICASAATYLACAGNHVRMALDSTYMVHKPASGIFGDAADLRKMAEVLDSLESGIVSLYADYTRQPRLRIQQLVESETWMNAEQALDLGFAHELTGRRAMQPAGNLARFGYQKTPEHLLRQPVRPTLAGGKLRITTSPHPGMDRLQNVLANQRLQLDHAALVDKIERQRRRTKARSGR